jgi:hypothetical protein
VWRMLVAQRTLGIRIIKTAIVWGMAKMGLQHLELPKRFATDHPLRDANFRDVEIKAARARKHGSGVRS